MSPQRSPIAGPEEPEFAIKVKGEVVKGFGRGSKELGIPTANLPEHATESLSRELDTGIYFGWARVGSNPEIYPMVMSIGWNPYYKNEKKSLEVHVIHSFESDFYGEQLRVIILGYIRPEKNYTSLDALIEDIHMDINVAKQSLQRQGYLQFKENDFFKLPSENGYGNH
ncbi:uncharacterized protein VTP21DRAFT_11094 [Calcarisporiella thermophila]|uniref:uncharacterized protein n=1 Tax=Calcarisporiella thermophila TaxID=911321 RepID=UPI0037427814